MCTIVSKSACRGEETCSGMRQNKYYLPSRFELLRDVNITFRVLGNSKNDF